MDSSDSLEADAYVTSRIGLEDVVEDGFEALLGGSREERKIMVCPRAPSGISVSYLS